jgi:gluconate 2-dehydrogenase gamma chain
MAKRRQFLRIAAMTVGGSLVYTIDRQPFRVYAQDTGNDKKVLRIPLRFFDERQALIIAAAAARIFPSDAAGPGAAEANVVLYIDGQLAGPYGRDRFRYVEPPFEPGVPEQGYQGKETPREVYLAGLRELGPDFFILPTEAQDLKLREVERTYFFRLLRQHVIEGMFCDPMHGGNADLIGWQLIGFPGPYMSWASEFGKHDGERFRPKPRSLAQVIGHPVKPWDGESR